MTKEEKIKFLNLQTIYQSEAFLAEIMQKNEFLSLIPTQLFKYKEFNENTKDMIEKNYIYLAPAFDLDDPFDCLTDIKIDELYDKDKSILLPDFIEYIVDIIIKHQRYDKFAKEKLINLINKSIDNEKIDSEKLSIALSEDETLSEQDRNLLYQTIINIENIMKTVLNGSGLKNLLTRLAESKEKIGIYSLTTKNDNKPMWSHYADVYGGCCIEYDIPLTTNVINNLYPVIYTNDTENNSVKVVLEYVMEVVIRMITNGTVPTNIGCIMNAICTKDIAWEYQDEWRIIGNPKVKTDIIKIKNIYLGCNVSAENENFVIKQAKQNNYGVYKMNELNGKKAITYKKII